ncbi:MAG: DUF2905 domain-containing protein [Syntrophomonadaceae bacterium]|nr:DUF2905 domain-containing protein [Syntrophomonadaceae bacterium]MDD3890209.1 DUF2905 domain-containing protein [Syntrophomonadaceae bacterium]MDD4548657.1 DUF2905 domain-containing protein [Syntrophomonadaceae bacterium]
MIMGIIILISGVIFYLFSRIGLTGLKLPGDIYIRKGNFTFYFPLVTCLIISIILTLIFNVLGRK